MKIIIWYCSEIVYGGNSNISINRILFIFLPVLVSSYQKS